MSEPGPIKFPVPRPPVQQPTLSLRRRTTPARDPFGVSEASAAARESIRAIVSATRPPFGGSSEGEVARILELERTLRQLELTLAERERIVGESEARLSDHERDLAEVEALLEVREKMLSASRHSDAGGDMISPEEKEALKLVRAELERQELSLKETRESMREREQFLDASEEKLFEKVQSQQEKEIELEQREEDLRARERRLREREAALDPEAAAKLKAEDEAAKKRDEFRE